MLPIEEIDDLLTVAATYYGKHYCYGGTGSRCFDCSGFAKTCFKAVGIHLERSSRSQAYSSSGRDIYDPKSLQRGDLIYFAYRQGRVSHVGIVVDKVGERVQFIHASVSRGITYDWLPEWKNKVFVKGKRFFEDITSETPRSLDLFYEEITFSKEEDQSSNKDREAPQKTESTRQFPMASERYLSYSDIEPLTPCQRRIMKNEIYAIHGYKFSKNPKMMKHFENLDWYRSIPEKYLSAGEIYKFYCTDIEKANILLLIKWEGAC